MFAVKQSSILACLALAACAAHAPAFAQSASQGIAAMGVITDDAGWEKEWRSSGTPSFHSPAKVAKGQPYFFILFVGRPAAGPDGLAHVACDLKVKMPDGAIALERSGMPCMDQPVSGDPRSIYLSRLAIKSAGDPPDPVGPWRYEATVHDRVSGKSASWASSVELTP